MGLGENEAHSLLQLRFLGLQPGLQRVSWLQVCEFHIPSLAPGPPVWLLTRRPTAVVVEELGGMLTASVPSPLYVVLRIILPPFTGGETEAQRS